MRVIPIIPGIFDYDLMLSLERALCGAGYRVDETLHYFAYDWRLRIIDLGVALARARCGGWRNARAARSTCWGCRTAGR